jgi:hypothetical protein
MLIGTRHPRILIRDGLPVPTTHVSFRPQTYYLTSKALPLDKYQITAHAWAQNGALFAGCSTGEVLLVDSQTGRVRGPQFLEQLDKKLAEARANPSVNAPASGNSAGEMGLSAGSCKPGSSPAEKGNKIPLGVSLPGINLLPGKLGGVGAKSTKPGGKALKSAGGRNGVPDVLPGDGEPVVNGISDEPVTLLAITESHVVYGGHSRGFELKELKRLERPSIGMNALSSNNSFRRQSGLVLDVAGGPSSPQAVKGITHGFQHPVADENRIELGNLNPVSVTQNPTLAQLLVLASDGSLHTVDLTQSDSRNQSVDVSRDLANHSTDSRSRNLSSQNSSIDENRVFAGMGSEGKTNAVTATAHLQSSFHSGGLSGLAVLTPLKLLVTAGAGDGSLCFWGMERGSFVAKKSVPAKTTCIQAFESSVSFALHDSHCLPSFADDYRTHI